MSWQNGEPRSAPNVYLPHGDGESTPAYDAYADPAAAHGWQDPYEADEASGAQGVEETVRMPAVRGALEVYEGGGPVAPDRHARLLRRRRARLLRRLVVAVGLVCAVGLVLALAGAFGSGSSEGAKPGGQSNNGGGREASATTESGGGSPTTGGASSAPSSATSAARGDESPSASGTASAPASAGTSKSPSGGSTPSTPTASGTAGEGPGNSGDNPGRGKGATKSPR